MTDQEVPHLTPRERFRHWYEHSFMPLYARWTPAVLAACIVFSAFAMVSTYLQQRTQDRVTQTLLDCFDTYADNTYSVSKEVRAAQQHTDTIEARADAAAAKRDAAFQDVLVLVISQNEDEEEGLRVFTTLTEANAELVEQRAELVIARNDLRLTREEHPVPNPPSKFCELPD